MTDITAVGEILIDLTQSGVNDSGIPVFAANPGGAPADLEIILAVSNRAAAIPAMPTYAEVFGE